MGNKGIRNAIRAARRAARGASLAAVIATSNILPAPAQAAETEIPSYQPIEVTAKPAPNYTRLIGYDSETAYKAVTRDKAYLFNDVSTKKRVTTWHELGLGVKGRINTLTSEVLALDTLEPTRQLFEVFFHEDHHPKNPHLSEWYHRLDVANKLPEGYNTLHPQV